MIFSPDKNNKIYDISPKVSSKSAVFPGDKKFSQKISLDYNKGHSLMLSSFESTCHIGAHADAPLHYSKEGNAIDSQELSIYLGPCSVIDVSSCSKKRLTKELFPKGKIKSQRILLKTGSIKNFDLWQDDFLALSKDLIKLFSEKGIILVGVDTPSLDPSNDPKLESHTECFEQKIAILENLDLKNVDEGEYNLIALPLKLKGLEASPVRAILIG